MGKSLNWWTRKFHRWGAILIALPLVIVIASGLLLQVKKQFSWIQPPTTNGSGTVPAVTWSELLRVTKANQSSEVETWNDVDRLDVRVDKGIVKVQCKNGWELQIDSITGEVLSSAYRRSDLIENIHDGSFFTEPTKLWIFLPSGILLLVLARLRHGRIRLE